MDKYEKLKVKNGPSSAYLSVCFSRFKFFYSFTTWCWFREKCRNKLRIEYPKGSGVKVALNISFQTNVYVVQKHKEKLTPLQKKKMQ
jgi:hypothetical protein